MYIDIYSTPKMSAAFSANLNSLIFLHRWYNAAAAVVAVAVEMVAAAAASASSSSVSENRKQVRFNEQIKNTEEWKEWRINFATSFECYDFPPGDIIAKMRTAQTK